MSDELKDRELQTEDDIVLSQASEHAQEAIDEEVDVEAVLKEFDRESNTRHFAGVPKLVVRYMLVAFAAFCIWMNAFSTLPEQVRRATFVGMIVFMIFMLFPAKKKQRNVKINYVPWYDFILGVVGGGCFFYYVFNFKEIVARAGINTELDIIIGVIGILILAEGCRRAVGIPILVVVAAFIGYAFYSGFSLKRIVAHLFYTTEGVIGTPLGVCSTFIVLFIIFAAFLEKTGVGKFFIDVANSIAGSATGGPAKVAIISSALQGMISGSSVANTVGSGSFTIPMMKKTGYKPEFAAAVEAAASTGGQLMPPIMGAAAFLMAEITGIPYKDIIIAAIVPAFLYFTGIFLMVHFEAKKLGLKGLRKEDLPKFGKLMLSKGYLLLPLVVLVTCMMTGSTASRSALYAIAVSIIVSLFRSETRISPKGVLDALENGAKNTLGVAAACSVAGMIVGVVTLTGIGLKLASGLLTLSGGIPIVALFFTMIACIILGMGVPTTANYVIMATITAPIVVQLGVPVLAAHMFVFYFGIVADITPPVALAAYAGSAIAKSEPLKTGVTATRIAITAFLVPYVFAFNPQMLIIGADSPLTVVQITLTALIGMYGIATGMEGFMRTLLPVYIRLPLIAAGLCMIVPGTVTDIIGFAVIALVFIWQRAKKVNKDPMIAA
ncbi:MAG: TRAP transporter permease [Clostridiales bacterium]|nr:TRAP transporter permease [Clostridiales bacterium]